MPWISFLFDYILSTSFFYYCRLQFGNVAKPQTKDSASYNDEFLCLRSLGHLAYVCFLLFNFRASPTLSSSAPLRIYMSLIAFWAVVFPRSVFSSCHCLLPWVWLVAWDCPLEALALFSVALPQSPHTLIHVERISHPTLMSLLLCSISLVIISSRLCSCLPGCEGTKDALIFKKMPPFNKQLLSLIPTGLHSFPPSYILSVPLPAAFLQL